MIELGFLNNSLTSPAAGVGKPSENPECLFVPGSVFVPGQKKTRSYNISPHIIQGFLLAQIPNEDFV